MQQEFDRLSMTGSTFDLCVSPPGTPVRTKSTSAELLSPDVSKSPSRRVSIGAMESVRRKMVQAEADLNVNHGRSSSMDSTAIATAKRLEWQAGVGLSAGNFEGFPNSSLRDCVSSSNLIHKDRYDSSEDLMASPPVNPPMPPTPDKLMTPSRRMHAIRKRFSPRHTLHDRHASSSSTGSSPVHSPARVQHSRESADSAYNYMPESELCLDMAVRQRRTVSGSPDCLESPSGTLTPRNASSGGSMETLMNEGGPLLERSVSKDSAPKPVDFKIPVMSLDDSHVKPKKDLKAFLKPQRSVSPFRKPQVPEPVFYQVPEPKAPESPPKHAYNAQNTRASPSHGRRLERRYHTAGAIEDLRPRIAQPQIKKRFSWNTTYQRPSNVDYCNQIPPLFEQLKDDPSSQCSLSSDSFCTSSSGISSSSSRVCYSPTTGQSPLVTHERADHRPDSRDHVSSVMIECPSPLPGRGSDHVPRIETQEATPSTTPVSGSNRTSFDNDGEPPLSPPFDQPLKEEMLRMILENKLEAS